MKYLFLILLLISLCFDLGSQDCTVIGKAGPTPALTIDKSACIEPLTLLLVVALDVREYWGSQLEPMLDYETDILIRKYQGIGIPIIITRDYLDYTIESNRVNDILVQWTGLGTNFVLDIAEDMGVYITRQASGGVAVVDQLGRRFPFAVCSVRDEYSQDDGGYSTALVLMHETGHIIGANHTHSCRWPEGALDNFYPPEGTCSPGPEALEGTILSYAHLRRLMSWNFHTTVANDMFARAANYAGTCVVPDCEDPTVVQIVFGDSRPEDITWTYGEYSGGPYPRGTSYVSDTLCVEKCDEFKIYDSFGDGLVGECVSGFIRIGDDDYDFEGDSLTIGGCVTMEPCTDVYAGEKFETFRDLGTFAIEDNTLHLYNNIWYRIDFEHTIRSSTVLTFDVLVDDLGQIQGVGVSRGIYPRPELTYRLAGHQDYGIQWPVRVGEWVTVALPIGTIITGEIVNLWIINDDDRAFPVNNMSIKNICLTDANNLVADPGLYDILGRRSAGDKRGVYFQTGPSGTKKVIR